VAAAFLAGCSAHDEYPKTPSYIATTPTYRTTTNSTDPVHEPFYLTPGINGGQSSTAPSLPAPDRYSANNPLAVSVYVALIHNQAIDSQYIAVEGKPNSVWLKGTVASADQKAKIDAIARNTPGVKSVKDDLVVQG
jgi:hypothetical protein